MTKEQILKVFEDTGSILSGHFILTSGRHSGTYMQCAKLFTDAAQAKKICEALCQKLGDINADYIVSPAVGGIIMGYQIAQILGVKNIFFERENGKMTLRRGFSLPKGSNVVVVEDVVTTGGSVKEVAECVQSMGSNVLAVAAIVDRSANTAQFGVPFISLLDLEIQTFDTAECPQCKAGNIAYKPGSRTL